MARRDDVGALLEGDGIEDTTMDGDGDNTGDAGDQYRGALQFGTTFAEASRGQCLDERLAEEEPDVSQEPRGDHEWSGRGRQRELAELVAGGDGSHSRTDPDLLGHGDYDSGLSAEEAAMHLMYKPPGSLAYEAVDKLDACHRASRTRQVEPLAAYSNAGSRAS